MYFRSTKGRFIIHEAKYICVCIGEAGFDGNAERAGPSMKRDEKRENVNERRRMEKQG